jgi:hypothetical protein
VIRYIRSQEVTIPAKAKAVGATAQLPAGFEKLLPRPHVPKAERPIPASARQQVTSWIDGHAHAVVGVPG